MGKCTSRHLFPYGGLCYSETTQTVRRVRQSYKTQCNVRSRSREFSSGLFSLYVTDSEIDFIAEVLKWDSLIRLCMIILVTLLLFVTS